MPKGVYSRDGEFVGVWTAEQDEWLKARCTTNQSYRAIAVDFAKAFPHVQPAKTRSAVLGRCARKGFNAFKPPAANDTRRRKPKAKAIVAKPKVVRDRKIPMLRDDAESRLKATPMRRPRGAQQIEEARKGNVPVIVETLPTHSVPLSDAARGSCKWPTNDDPSNFHVCGQPGVIGSYCERHAQLAYREMPTVRRNKITRAQAAKKIRDEDAQWIADNVLDDVIETKGELSPELVPLLEQFTKVA